MFLRKLSKGEDRGWLKISLRDFLCYVSLLNELVRNEDFVGQQSPEQLRMELTPKGIGSEHMMGQIDCHEAIRTYTSSNFDVRI